MQTVVLFSDANFLSIGILENLLTKSCLVNVVTKDVKGWQQKTSHLPNKSRFNFFEQKDFTNRKFSYSIIVSGFLKGDPYETVNEVFKNFNLEQSKNLIVIPFEKYSFEKKEDKIIPPNIGIIYLGDVIGPRMDLESDLLISQLITSIFYKHKIILGIGEVIYPLFISDAVKTLTKWLFSFGPYEKETLLVGSQTSGSDFWRANANIVKDLKIEYDEKLVVRRFPRSVETKSIQSDLKVALSETFKWINYKRPEEPPKIVKPKIKSSKPPVKLRIPKFVKPLGLTVILILIFPLITLITGSALMYFSYGQFLGGNDKNSENLLLLSKTFSVITREGSTVLAYIPILGGLYKETAFTSQTLARVSDMGVSAIPVFRSSSDLVDKMLGNGIYDPTSDTVEIKSGLEDLYREISLLQADTNSGVSDGLFSAKFLNKKVNLEKYKNLAQYGKDIAGNLPGVLGKGQTKTYLLLFQNNMELRPTGGFIGSFGILTFDGGRITDLTVNDVYSADGQLNGHVEPPGPIKTYLGEANWWLRDSNWDPDFPTSAKRAEWFLDKEMGKDVDGVIAVDLDPVKNILKYTGPVFLPDYNLNISSDNLYEKTQAEVQENFFPGSRKKASFLTALSRSLLTEVSKLSSGQKTGILRSFYQDLDGRHVQVFMHDDVLQNSVSGLAWDGGVLLPSCGDACYADFAGDVEANLGVNKANYFVERKQDLAVKITSGSIERTLDITLKNNSNPALGPSGKYKSYMRILVPVDATVVSATAFSGDGAEPVNPDITEVRGHKEVGMLVEVLGQQIKKLQVKWKTQNPQDAMFTKYGIYFRKQAGVTDDPFSLTVNGQKVYNSTLADDYFGRFNLK